MPQYQDMDTAFAGLKGDSRNDTVESYAASEDIEFGRGVMANATDPAHVVDVADNAGGVFRGVALHIHNEARKYEEKDTVSVLRKGLVWVETGVAVTIDEPAYVDVAIGGIGKFTNVSASNLATGGTFRSSVAAAGLALLEIDL
jgi:hypothetical protein